MLIPRFHRFRMSLPQKIVPTWVNDLYKDILADAGLLNIYAGNPVNCIAESVCNFSLPGIHMKILEQSHHDATNNGSYKTYYPIGDNAMDIIDDNELSIQFRLIDGMHNYMMIMLAMAYMADDNAQTQQGEEYKEIGTLTLDTELTDRFSLHREFSHVIYSGINGNEFDFSKRADEAGFTVRMKFTEHIDSFYVDGQCISKRAYNHNLGN